MINLFRLARIARTEFSDIVVATTVIRDKLRVVLEDGSTLTSGGQQRFRGGSLITGNGFTLMGQSIGMTICPILAGKGCPRSRSITIKKNLTLS
jgi:hypothetical protein